MSGGIASDCKGYTSQRPGFAPPCQTTDLDNLPAELLDQGRSVEVKTSGPTQLGYRGVDHPSANFSFFLPSRILTKLTFYKNELRLVCFSFPTDFFSSVGSGMAPINHELVAERPACKVVFPRPLAEFMRRGHPCSTGTMILPWRVTWSRRLERSQRTSRNHKPGFHDATLRRIAWWRGGCSVWSV